MLSKQNNQSVVADISIGPLQLTSGDVLNHATLRYERVGPTDAPTILVCHALTGNHYTVGTDTKPGWWRGLINEGSFIDTRLFQVITFNVLGGCDGSTGPTTINPETGKAYQASFPCLSVLDLVNAQYKALKQLKIDSLHAVIGGSLGGMQTLEWGLSYPNIVNNLVPLAVTPYLSDYGIAFNHIAKTAVENDPTWNNGDYDKSISIIGLEIARMIGMVTYRSSTLFSQRFNRDITNEDFNVASYLNYQGEKLSQRFDANSYLILLEAMNHFDIGKERGGWKEAYSSLRIPTLTLSYDKDLIYEPSLIKQCSSHLPHGTYYHIETNFGHDGFLVEYDKWGPIIKDFLNGISN